MKHIKINITGRVQGVFFRAETQNLAEALHITGWIKNESDGSVTIEAQGEEDSINRFMEWCKDGPPAASVDNIKIQQLEKDKSLTSFEIRY